jgi:hypothetical protein
VRICPRIGGGFLTPDPIKVTPQAEAFPNAPAFFAGFCPENGFKKDPKETQRMAVKTEKTGILPRWKKISKRGKNSSHFQGTLWYNSK